MKQEHFIKKIITAVFSILLIITAFLPGIELKSESTITSGSSGSSHQTNTIATMISPAQLISSGNASKEDLNTASTNLEKKAEAIYASGNYNSATAANDAIAKSKEASKFYSLLIRNQENIIPKTDTSSSEDKDFIKSSTLYSAVTIIFYILVVILLGLMIAQLFLDIYVLKIITKIVSILVLVGALASVLLVLPMSIYSETAATKYTISCGFTLAGPLAVILSIPTMILAIISCKRKRSY